MERGWIFRYRIEFPILICVLTTLVYTFNTDIFMIYRPILSLFIAFSVGSIGFFTHYFFRTVSNKDDFQFNKNSIIAHTKLVGDFFFVLGISIFTGSKIIIALCVILYVFSYKMLIKQMDERQKVKMTFMNVIHRDLNNFAMFSLALVYIYALKNMILYHEFTLSFEIKLFFISVIGLFLVLKILLAVFRKNQIKHHNEYVK